LIDLGANRVVRLRRGCPELQEEIRDHRYIEICIQSKNTLQQVTETAKVLGYSIRSKESLKDAIQMGMNAFEELCEREKRFTHELKLVFGDDIYNRVSKIHGVKTRIWDVEFRGGISRLLDLLEGDHTKLPTIMCGGLASRLHESEFREGISRLLELLEGDHTKLPTIMCNGLASRLHEPKFRENVTCVLSVGFSQKKIVTLLGDNSCVTKFDTKFSELINVGPTISRKRAREL